MRNGAHDLVHSSLESAHPRHVFLQCGVALRRGVGGQVARYLVYGSVPDCNEFVEGTR